MWKFCPQLGSGELYVVSKELRTIQQEMDVYSVCCQVTVTVTVTVTLILDKYKKFTIVSTVSTDENRCWSV